MRRVLVTGASGFIGFTLVKYLRKLKYDVVSTSRSLSSSVSLRCIVSPELDSDADWSIALKGCYAVVHLAARAHILDEISNLDNDAKYYQINTKATVCLLEQAIVTGVKRFIFISSIGAVADTSSEPLKVNCQCYPSTSYGRSKLAAEVAIKEICAAAKICYTIIRPALVYGPKNPGNMARLLKIADSGIPLPLSALDLNCRSFIGISNLVDLIRLCLDHPASANQTFHASDNDDISTSELLRRMGKALGKPVRNLPIPQGLLKTGLKLVGKGKLVDKLCGDLRVDISKTKQLLGWKPIMTMEEELERTAEWWRSRQGVRVISDW